MVRFVSVSVCAVILLSAGAGIAAELEPRLADFAPLVGKTWRGTLVQEEGAEPDVDISRWEVALGGKAVRIVHSLNRGEYGGETILFWDEKEGHIVFYYFTNAGFHTQGTVTFADGAYTTHEVVAGNSNGITEVRSTGRLLPDGRMHNISEYLQHGEWVPGHEVYYVEDPEAKVIFERKEAK